jgi:DNA adenine methylase
MVKPIIKWVGGKTQIIHKLIDKFPKNIDNYHEIFLGGGSVLLEFLSNVKNDKINVKNKIYAYDLNEPLIYLYINIQTKFEELYKEIEKIIIEFNSCLDNEIIRNPIDIEQAMQSKENYYYWCRKLYNNLKDNKTIKKSALFVFLNKTCFRGMYRTGPNGFNVPYGNYVNPEIANYEHFKEVNELIKNVIFICCDFTNSIKTVKKGDFVYMDPPYYPEKKNSFVSYNENGFENHDNLFELCKKMESKFMMSNSDSNYVKECFNNYKIEIVECKRTINSKKPQSKTNEIIVTNY